MSEKRKRSNRRRCWWSIWPLILAVAASLLIGTMKMTCRGWQSLKSNL